MQAMERERAGAVARSDELAARLEAALLRLTEVERREAQARREATEAKAATMSSWDEAALATVPATVEV